MQLSVARIGPLAGPADISPTALRELLHRNGGTGPGVEHIRVRAGPGHLDIAVFTAAGTQLESDETTRHLITTTLANEPELRLWRLL
jgi:hypothetical protein